MCLKKLFKPIGVGSASALIAVTTLMSYAVGLIRDRTIAVHFGTTTATDTYNASFLIPDVLFNLFIAGALTAAFMPVFSEYLNKDKKVAMSMANTMLTSASLLIAGLLVLAFIFMEHIIPWIFPEVSPEGQKNIIQMTRIMLPSAFLFTISNALGNILMSYRHFLSFSLSPVFYNLGIIFGVVFFNEQFGIYSAAIGVLIGGVFHAIIRIIDTLYTEYKYKPELKVRDPGFKKIIKLMIPKAISLIAWQINVYIFSIVGMKMIEGGLAAFNFARNIQGFAVTLFGVAFATAIFPSLNTAHSVGDKERYTRDTQTTIQRILFFTIPAAIGVSLLAVPLTDLILGGGKFDANSLTLTSSILIFFAISIPFESLTQLFTRSYYAMQNTMTPTLINIFAFAIIAVITIFVAPVLGINWFSIGYAIGFIVYNTFLMILLSKHLKGFKISEFFRSLVKMLIAGALMGIIIYITKDANVYLNFSKKIFYCLQIALGGATYLLVAYLLKSPEMTSVRFLLKRLIKKGNV